MFLHPLITFFIYYGFMAIYIVIPCELYPAEVAMEVAMEVAKSLTTNVPINVTTEEPMKLPR